ncbi:hypothetical protein [Shimazuella kribbensis]|uniref:hypothetical protein n=1 Tax=Shimazuella kribbensis TaxID=139808 RepID=UPI00041C6EAE|nr:hypothetical protein [Shimazuella kribbensis]
MLRKTKMSLALCLAVIGIGTGSVYASADLLPDVPKTKPVINKTISKKPVIKKSSSIQISQKGLLQLLHLTSDELQKQLSAGKTIVEIAKENGVTEKELTKFLTNDKQSSEEIEKSVKAKFEHVRTIHKDQLITKSKQGDGVHIISKSQLQTK